MQSPRQDVAEDETAIEQRYIDLLDSTEDARDSNCMPPEHSPTSREPRREAIARTKKKRSPEALSAPAVSRQEANAFCRLPQSEENSLRSTNVHVTSDDTATIGLDTMAASTELAEARVPLRAHSVLRIAISVPTYF